MTTRQRSGQNSCLRTILRAGATLIGALWLAAPACVLARPVALSPRVCAAGPSPQVHGPLGFLGFGCRDDRCGSHKAGFVWAERNGIVDARECVARNDPAFTEGCRVYAEQAVTAEQAGFEWARQNDLLDACLCAGAGARFEAGCQAYVDAIAE